MDGKQLKPSFIDRIVGVFSPKAFFGRLQARAGSNYILHHYNDSASRKGKGWGRIDRADISPEPIQEIYADLYRARNKCRDMYRNYPIFRGIIEVLTQHVVGNGLKLNIKVDKLTEDESKIKAYSKLERDLEESFRNWARKSEKSISGGI